MALVPIELLREIPMGPNEPAGMACLREESGACYPVVLRGGGQGWEELFCDVQYDAMLPYGHAPRKPRLPL